MKTILITGGAGFIGSHVVRRFVTRYPDYRIINLDKLTYAGNLANLKDIEKETNYEFIRADIVDAALMQQIFARYRFSGIIHLAAESHVDRHGDGGHKLLINSIVRSVSSWPPSKPILLL